MKFWLVFQAEISGKFFLCQNSKPKFHAKIFHAEMLCGNSKLKTYSEDFFSVELAVGVRSENL